MSDDAQSPSRRRGGAPVDSGVGAPVDSGVGARVDAPAGSPGADARAHDAPDIVVVGRGIHPPWNEGTRVTAWNLARAAASRARVFVISITNPRVADPQGEMDSPATPPGRLAMAHVRTRQPYGLRSDYAGLAGVVRRLARLVDRRGPGLRRPWIAHLVGAPLILAPWIQARGGRVVAHVTLTDQAYQTRLDRLRAALGWRLFDRWIDAYACASTPIRNELIKRGQSPEKLRILPPGIDAGRFRPASRLLARAALGWPAEDVVVAYMGTITPLRFPAADVLAGLEQVQAHIPHLRLAVYAPVATHPYNLTWAETNERALRTSVPLSVHLGDLTDEAKARVFQAADAVLFPFAAPVAVEPPLTLLEAMACGAIPFATPNANRSRIVADGANGFTWNSPTTLAAALRYCLEATPERRAALGRAARETVVQRFGMDVTTERLEALWLEVRARSRGRVRRRGAGPNKRTDRGLTVAVVGPDGAGKSTLIRALASRPALDALPIYLGTDRLAATHALPTTRWLVRRRGRRSARDRAESEGGHPGSGAPGAPPTGATGRLVRAAWATLSLPHELAEFGYRLLVAARARRRGRVVLFDRFVYDSLVDAAVDGAGRWQRFRARALAALGKPDLMLILDAPGEVLFARKGEHSPDRLERVRAAIPTVARRVDRVVVLDATQSVDALAAIAEAEIARARLPIRPPA